MKRLLIIEDDVIFCHILQDAMGKKGFEVGIACNYPSAVMAAETFHPEYVLLDLKMQHESGLALIPLLLKMDPAVKIVVLTGYATVATAVEAIKLGAVYYLAKPVEIHEIMDAFERRAGNPDQPVDSTPTIDQLENAHIRAVLERNHGNISATARELKMHRRSLQRKLEKVVR